MLTVLIQSRKFTCWHLYNCKTCALHLQQLAISRCHLSASLSMEFHKSFCQVYDGPCTTFDAKGLDLTQPSLCLYLTFLNSLVRALSRHTCAAGNIIYIDNITIVTLELFFWLTIPLPFPLLGLT